MQKIKNALSAVSGVVQNIVLFALVVLAWLLCFL